MPATISTVTEDALTLSAVERAQLARTLLDSVESPAVTPGVAAHSLTQRREIIAKFVSGDWGAELSGFEEMRAADRAAAARLSDTARD